MRPSYSTITPSVVHHFARSVLERTLGFQPSKPSVSLHQLLDLLLVIAATTRTLFAVVGRYFDFSHETARQAVYANLTTLDVLTQRLVDALHAVAAFSGRDRRRLWTLAIDLHYVPYYGSKKTPGILGGPKKQGTQFFHCYATAVLIHRRRRYTVGLSSVPKGLKPHDVVKTLLEQIRSRGLCVGGVVLDAGFDSGETILLLQEQKVSYTIPLRRKGKGTNRRNECYSKPSGTLATVDWVTEKSRKSVQTRVLVWQRKGESQTKVYAFSGWGEATAVSEIRRAWLGRRRYRQRFGIETSYRQKNECRVSFAVGRIGVGIAPGVGVPDATDREGSWPATERVGQRVATGRDAQLARRGHPKPLPTNPMHHTRQQYTYDQRSTLKLLVRERVACPVRKPPAPSRSRFTKKRKPGNLGDARSRLLGKNERKRSCERPMSGVR